MKIMTTLNSEIIYKKLINIAGKLSTSIKGSADIGPDIILCYHDVDDDNWKFSVTKQVFETHINFLATKTHIVSLKEILSKANKSNKTRIAITFDDGYRGVYTNAFPILNKYKVKGTVFVVGTKRLAQQHKKSDLLLYRKDIKHLHNAGWNIGWHTKNHSDITKLTVQELENDLMKERKRYEKEIGIDLNYFAYPYGYFNTKTKKVLKISGITKAFTIGGGKVAKHDRYTISRVTVTRDMDLIDLENIISPWGLKVNQSFVYFWRMKDMYLTK